MYIYNKNSDSNLKSPLITLFCYKMCRYTTSRLSPFFIDRCFTFLSIVGFDSAEGQLCGHSVFSKCSSVSAPKSAVNVIRKSVPNHNLLRIRTQINSKAVKLNSHVVKFNRHAVDLYRHVNASSLFRKRSTSAFLLFTLTRSLLPNTELYSVYSRSLLIISLKSVKLHLAFDYTDYSFADSVLSTDISSLKFCNSF